MQPLPKQVQVVKYGPDGSSVASVGTATYSPAADGSSHSIRLVSQTDKGRPLSDTELSVNEAGIPSSATTVLYDPYDGTVRQHQKADYSGLEWTSAMHPQKGRVKMTAHNHKKKKAHNTEISFDNEQLRNVAITHMSLGDDATPQGHTDLDFAEAKMIGRRLVGGQINIVHRRADKSVSAKSSLKLTEGGLASLLDVTKYEKDGVTPAVRSQWDYSKVTFDARRRVYAGSVFVTNTNPDGKLRSATEITHDRGRAIKMVTKRADGRIIETPLKSATDEEAAGETPLAAASVPATTPSGNEKHRTTVVKRPDGTTERRTEQWYTTKSPGGKEVEIPLRVVIQNFATDGMTIVDRKEISFSSAEFGDGVSGTVQVDSFVNDKKVRHAAVEYA